MPDAAAYERFGPVLVEQLLGVRRHPVEADLGDGIETACWPAT